MAFAGVFLITLGYDEAWILSGIQDILQPRALDVTVVPVLTSGGFFALGQLLVTALFGAELWPQRLFCFASMAAVVAIVWRWGMIYFGDMRSGALVVSALVATPGMAVLGSTAYATVPAFLLVLVSVAVFFGNFGSRALRITGTAALVGLASATRFECVLLLPALCLYAWFSQSEQKRRNVIDAVVASLLAVPVSAAFVTLYWLAGPQQIEHGVAQATGLAIDYVDYTGLLNKWVISEAFLPLPMLVLATVLAFYFHRQQINGGHAKWLCPWILLAPFGWFVWALWYLYAPIAHLRYVWPGLASFMVLLGFGIAGLYAWGRRNEAPGARIAALLLALSCVVAAIGATGRNLVLGNGDILSWEWAGDAPRAYFTRFRHIGYQRQAARYLRETTQPGERVLALGIGRSLGYLAQRDVLEIGQYTRRVRWDPARVPRRMVLEPVVGNFVYFSDEARRWIVDNTELEAQFGPYAFYRLTGSYPDDPTMLKGTTRIYTGHPHAQSYR